MIERFEDNQKLVEWIVTKCEIRPSDREEAVQEGLVALWRASESFDGGRGVKFSSFAARCVWNALTTWRARRANRVEELPAELISREVDPFEAAAQKEHQEQTIPRVARRFRRWFRAAEWDAFVSHVANGTPWREVVLPKGRSVKGMRTVITKRIRDIRLNHTRAIENAKADLSGGAD